MASIANAVGKNHWKFDFTRGHGFQAYDDYGKPYPVKWDRLNFSSVMQHAQRHFRGEQGMFESLAYRLFNLAGVATSNTQFVHFRVIDHWAEVTSDQYTGDFWGLYLAIENMDGQFLDDHDLPDGNLYDMHDWTGELDNLGDYGVTDKSDLYAFMKTYVLFVSRCGLVAQARLTSTGYYRFRSVLEAVHHYDVDQGKNYYFYLNPRYEQVDHPTLGSRPDLGREYVRVWWRAFPRPGADQARIQRRLSKLLARGPRPAV